MQRFCHIWGGVKNFFAQDQKILQKNGDISGIKMRNFRKIILGLLYPEILRISQSFHSSLNDTDLYQAKL